MKCILVFDPSDIESATITQVVKTYRYRNVGIPFTLYHSANDSIKKLLDKKPFRKLTYPLDVIDEFSTKLMELYDGWQPAIEAMILASTYIAPLLIHQRAVDYFNSFLVWEVRSNRIITHAEFKLHLRIAYYMIQDFHEAMTTEAYKTILEYKDSYDDKMLHDLCRQRTRTLIADGEKRFWRLYQHAGAETIAYKYKRTRSRKKSSISTEGTEVPGKKPDVVYLDIMRLLINYIITDRNKFDKLMQDPNVQMVLAPTCGIILQ
jgi:hypothetical protein